MPDLSRIKKTFDGYFSRWRIELPSQDLSNRRRGKIQQHGWHIQYLFGSDEKGEYMDFYASHRMTNDEHVRLYADGHRESLPAYADFRLSSQDPAEDARFEAEFQQDNDRISKLLQAKGFQ